MRLGWHYVKSCFCTPGTSGDGLSVQGQINTAFCISDLNQRRFKIIKTLKYRTTAFYKYLKIPHDVKHDSSILSQLHILFYAIGRLLNRQADISF